MTLSPPMRIVVNHDNPLSLQGLVALVESYARQSGTEIEIVRAPTAEAVSAEVQTAACYFLHERSFGAEAACDFVREVRGLRRGARICLIVEHRKILKNEEVMTVGVNALACTSCTVDDLAQAIEATYLGSVFFSPRIATLMRDHFAVLDALRARYGLTDRELEIIPKVAAGQSSKEIARDLDISPRTVESHRQRILNKCNLKNSMMIARLLSDAAGEAA